MYMYTDMYWMSMMNISSLDPFIIQTQKELMRLDEQELNNRYKVGVLYCKAGQTNEEEWYNNGEYNYQGLTLYNH